MSKVAVIKTDPQNILEDTQRLMHLAQVKDALKAGTTTILKNNLSWHLMFPGANTTPWQLEGTILGLRRAGFTDLVCVENETVVTNAKKGEQLNKQRLICDYHQVPIKYNFMASDMRWQVYKPLAPMLVLDKIFPKGIQIPDYFIGKNIVHLPTAKCHIYTNISGAIKNAFGGLLNNKRHYCHSQINEALVDLLSIQKEIHPGIFVITDATTAGDGPGPRTMTPITKNILLASTDSVAIDAVVAKLMGFEPMDHPFIRLAHERGLGKGRPEEIEIIGDVDLKKENWNFNTGDNSASKIGKFFWFGPLKGLQTLMFHTPLVYGFIFASAIYHDKLWYPIKGRKIVNNWLRESPWGRLFADYKPTGLQYPAETIQERRTKL